MTKNSSGTQSVRVMTQKVFFKLKKNVRVVTEDYRCMRKVVLKFGLLVFVLLIICQPTHLFMLIYHTFLFRNKFSALLPLTTIQ